MKSLNGDCGWAHECDGTAEDNRDMMRCAQGSLSVSLLLRIRTHFEGGILTGFKGNRRQQIWRTSSALLYDMKL